MSLTSFSFFGLFILFLGAYYLLPGRMQWKALLIGSVLFFGVSCRWYTGIYLIVTILVTWWCAGRTEENAREQNPSGSRFLFIGLAVDLGLLLVLKYGAFFLETGSGILNLLGRQGDLPAFHPLLPLGISFYTMQAAAYLMDVHRGTVKAEKNIWKTALYIAYFPLLTSGPILRFAQVREQLYVSHRFDWKQVTFGLQRMLWGIFKKLVISAHLAELVNGIFDHPEAGYEGFYIWIAAAAFMGQLYTDFSGCMDIVLGASECFGILLPENFRAPFFSVSVQEYWQRWHITLGEWMRDYVMYPLLRTPQMTGFGKWARGKYGKKTGRKLTSWLGMLCVWLLVGFWHGPAWKYILGMGLWFFGCIVLGEALQPVFAWMVKSLRINTGTRGWHLFCSLRVFWLVAVGNLFFRMSSIREVFEVCRAGFSRWNPQILLDGSVIGTLIPEARARLVIWSLLLLFGVSWLGETRPVRERIAEQNAALRWMIWILLIVSIAVFGKYGSGYEASAFIYQQF